MSHALTTRPRPTRWAGLIVFAGILLMLDGFFTALTGFAAIVNDDYYQVASDDLLLFHSYTTWGWVHLLLGVLVFLAGLGLMSGNPLARIAGVVLAVLNAIVALVFASAAPAWALIVITVDVLIIYAITVHGREMASV